jgi:hypothetical protein
VLFENRSGASIELLDDRLVLRREGKGASAQEKEVPYSAIKSVEFREAGIASGYIQLCLGKRKVSSLAEALTDENSILFARDLNGEFARLRDLVEQRMRVKSAQGRAGGGNAQDRLARLERLERLRASGTLEDSEFHAEKAKILSEQAEAARGPNSWLVLAVLVAIAVTGAILVGMWSSSKEEGHSPKPSLPLATTSVDSALNEGVNTPAVSQAMNVDENLAAIEMSLSSPERGTTAEPSKRVAEPAASDDSDEAFA